MGLLGIFVVLVELPCTGAPYFAILALLAKGMYADAVPYLLLYNFIFVAPLLAVIAIAYFGKTESMERWRAEHRGAMRLFTGLFLVALGAYMIYSLYLSFNPMPRRNFSLFQSMALSATAWAVAREGHDVVFYRNPAEGYRRRVCAEDGELERRCRLGGCRSTTYSIRKKAGSRKQGKYVVGGAAYTDQRRRPRVWTRRAQKAGVPILPYRNFVV